MTYSSPLKAATAAFGLAIAATGAVAQDSAQTDGAQTETQTQTQSSATYTDAKLDAFVTAALEVSDMRAQVQQELQSAESEEARQQVVANANAEIQTVIEQTEGITVEEYTEIGQSLGNDEELDARVGALVEEKSGGAQQ